MRSRLVLMALTLSAAALTCPTVHAAVNGGTVQWCIEYLNGSTCCGGVVPFGGSNPVNTFATSNANAFESLKTNCICIVCGSKPLSVVQPVDGATLDDYLLADNLNSSGQAGFSRSFAADAYTAGMNIGWTALTPTQSGPDSAFVDISLSGQLGGQPRGLGSMRYADAGAGQFRLSADFTSSGATTAQVVCYLGGSLVAQGAPRTAGTFGTTLSGGWPRGASANSNSVHAKNQLATGFGWSAPISFQINGGGGPTFCDSVTIVPIKPTAFVDGFSSVTYRFKNMDSLGVSSVHFTRISPALAPTSSVAARLGLGVLLLITGVGVLTVRTRSRGVLEA